jgi:hypothetical protein
MKKEEYIKWVQRNHPDHMTPEEYLAKYPPREDMDSKEMERILMSGPQNEEEAQKLAWFHDGWIDPEDRVPEKTVLIRLKETIEAMKTSGKGKGR